MTYLDNKQQELIRKVTEQIVAMIKEEGIEEFQRRIISALQRHSNDYTITCRTEEEMRECENMSK